MNHLAMFAKYWQPGQVKTRLAACVGDQTAGELYRRFVKTLARRLASCGDERAIVYAPANARDAFVSLAGPHWDYRPQPAGDLGTRLRTYVESALRSGANRVVVIGSDSPNLPIEWIDAAFTALTQNDVVVGPTSDGGYYLIGVAEVCPEIFDGIPWSTGDVWKATLARLASLGISFETLPLWYDVDTIDDLARLAADLSGGESVSADTASSSALIRRVERELARLASVSDS